jgi:serine/threonine protein phosphatase PrpC
MTDNINSILVDTFLDINSKLHKSQSLDTSFSGSTCCSMILTPEKVLTANVGDSRAVIGRLVDRGINLLIKFHSISMAKS